MKFLVAPDVDFLGKRAHISLYEVKRVMTKIDNEAATNGATPTEHMTLTEANTCYFRGESTIYATVPDKTPAGRPRIISKMKWGALLLSSCTKQGQ